MQGGAEKATPTPPPGSPEQTWTPAAEAALAGWVPEQLLRAVWGCGLILTSFHFLHRAVQSTSVGLGLCDLG